MKVTDDVLKRRLSLYHEHGSTKAAQIEGMNVRAFISSVRAAEGKGLQVAIKDPVQKAKAEITDLKRQVAALQKDADTAEMIRKEIYGLASHDPEPPKWLFEPGKNGSRGTPMTMWSDWHYGEVVDEKQVGGVNKFNSEIAEQRIKRLTNTIIDLSYNHMGRAHTKYPGIIVCLGGDMISGDIHDELRETNDRTPWQTVNDLTDIIAAALSTLADKFGKVFVPCVVGNHGRGTLKSRMKNRVFTSFEWNIYCNLKRYFKDDKRIQFMIPEETDARFNVYDTRFLLTHGDSIAGRGGDGIIGAIGPITRGAQKVGRSEASIGRDFDYMVIGHWHQMLWLPNTIVNNSLKGFDEYARLELRAPYSRPSQALWFVHPEHGITARWEVFVEGKQQAAQPTEWVSFPGAD